VLGLTLRAIDDVEHAGLAAEIRRIGRREHALQERIDLFGAIALRACETRLLARAIGFAQRDHGARDDRQCDRRPDRDGHAMPADELARAVAPARMRRQNGLTAQETLEIVRELRARRIAVARRFRERLQDDVGEIAIDATRARRLDGARPARLGAADDALDLGRRAAGDAVGPLADDELVQQHAERVNIARSADDLASHPLRARVFRRQRRDAGHREAARFAVYKLGDAEIEQLRLAALVDEDVRRLQVAMDDEPAVRRLHGFENLQEERREDAALVREARAKIAEIEAHELEGDSARVEGIGALGEIDAAHAAAAELAHEPPRTDRVAAAIADFRGQRLQETFGRLLAREQRIDLAAQRRVLAAGRVEIGVARIGRERERLVENGEDARRVVHEGAAPSTLIAWNSHRRAVRNSRSSVARESCMTSPISAKSRPPNTRSSTICARRASMPASRCMA
jgi:hypothetical protein